MLKKLASVILCLSMLLVSFTGCGSTSQQQSSGKTTATAVDKFKGNPSKEYYMVTFLSGYPFWKECYRGFEDAGKLYGVKTVYGGSTEYDINAAITALDQIIAKKPAGIAISCMDATAYIPSINKAREAGIPVITFDSDSPKSKRFTYIGTQNYQAGAAAARYIGQKLGGKGEVVAATSMGQTNIKERTQGFEETIKKEFPNIKVDQAIDAGNDQVTAANNVSNTLKKNADLNYIFCGNQHSVVGSQKALQEANMAGKVKIVGFDTDKTTLDAIKSGEVDATISQAPWSEGYWAMNYLYFLSNELVNPVDDWQKKGYPAVPSSIDSGTTVVTKENYDAFYTSK